MIGADAGISDAEGSTRDRRAVHEAAERLENRPTPIREPGGKPRQARLFR